METYHIHINGIVQGVGFRPLVYQIANEMQLDGYVKNGNDGVNIFFNASKHEANLFFDKLKQAAPARSEIISSELQRIEYQTFSGFSIKVEDGQDGDKRVLIPPDTAMCAACRTELRDENNRRYRYPFITCTQCGPRYSIINRLPYERHTTSMQSFTMCKSCNQEYNNVADRRFFSQTNSCADCGIKLSLWDKPSSVITDKTDEVLSNINDFIKQGKIIAVKGIGGYLLLCDANNPEAIRLLRSRKHRPSKPFAILYPGIEIVGNDFDLNGQEKALL